MWPYLFTVVFILKGVDFYCLGLPPYVCQHHPGKNFWYFPPNSTASFFYCVITKPSQRRTACLGCSSEVFADFIAIARIPRHCF